MGLTTAISQRRQPDGILRDFGLGEIGLTTMIKWATLRRAQVNTAGCETCGLDVVKDRGRGEDRGGESCADVVSPAPHPEFLSNSWIL